MGKQSTVMEEVLATYPDRLESSYNTWQRSEAFKAYLSEYVKKEEGQVVVVGHSTYFTYLTATKWPIKEEGSFDYYQQPTEYRFLANCEVYPFDRHLL